MAAWQEEKPLTLGELRDYTEDWPDEAVIMFGATINGDRLLYNRLKDRSPKGEYSLLHIELREESTLT